MNPFDEPDGVFSVVVNDEQQHSLWPSKIPVPAGWQVAHGADTRAGCLDYIEKNWTDLRPLSARPPQAI
jgi:uncharacterized protein YbdZ (MbtH family)